MTRGTGGRGRPLTKALLTAVATAIAAVHIAWPHLRIDLTTAALLAVAATPWLDHVFKSITTPFFSFEYREQLEKRLDAATEEAQSAKRLVEASETRELARQDARRSGVDDSLVKLAAEYNRIRAEMPSGDVRTAAMTRVVGRMIAAVEAGDQIDVRSELEGSDRGLRLAAYVSLYTKPEPSMVLPLVDALVSAEDNPFEQYWALRALRRMITSGAISDLDLNSVRKLKHFNNRLETGTDRAFELEQILHLLTV